MYIFYLTNVFTDKNKITDEIHVGKFSHLIVINVRISQRVSLLPVTAEYDNRSVQKQEILCAHSIQFSLHKFLTIHGKRYYF